jgi:hypothetical protein
MNHALGEGNVCRILVGKPKVKKTLGKLRSTWEDDNELDLREICEICCFFASCTRCFFVSFMFCFLVIYVHFLYVRQIFVTLPQGISPIAVNK